MNRKVTWRKYAYKVAQQWLVERNMIDVGDSKSTIYEKRNSLLADARMAIENDPKLFIIANDWAVSQNANVPLSRGKAAKLARKNIEKMQSVISDMGGSILSVYNLNNISYLSHKGEGAADLILVLKTFGIDLTNLLSTSCSIAPMKFVIEVSNIYSTTKGSVSKPSRRLFAKPSSNN